MITFPFICKAELCASFEGLESSITFILLLGDYKFML